MIDKDFDELASKVGGRFKLCTLVIKRARNILMYQDTGEDEIGRLNSQVIRAALDEIEDGTLQIKAAEEVVEE
ncbi:MAG: DNA-directed RNA polymerase subunit omega [Planctomycetota bacterium]|jgi:DNA-directed RNA polymerase omega subunit|nr:DNA-directed RNA polymerase subunit omega [Planctomycetota bacterium]MDP6355028.1 DNA-directed RNA polymerase subunit omega [Planctomycetota bacterium]MDP6504793.1 DNA-directed RNA polymerase subunit omega [Planctomycetota bacterium]MDP7131221.1 DNA-directed RNA polymerase subunit omega [Planctomycetota bacterium]MDP7251136.1 DNA-directed RNA polymerase subunit omega [Planctomycetota bacterium]